MIRAELDRCRQHQRVYGLFPFLRVMVMIVVTPLGCDGAQGTSPDSSSKKAKGVDLSYEPVTYFTLDEAIEQRTERLLAAKEILDNGGDRAAAHLEAGKLFHELRMIPWAIETFTYAIEAAPEQYEAYYHRARAYEKIKWYHKALQDYSRFLEHEPDNVDCLCRYALMHHRLGDSVKALEMLDAVIEQSPKHVHAINSRGCVLLDNHEADEAMGDFETVLQIASTYAAAYCSLALIRSSRDDNQGAIAMYSEAIRCDPAYGAAYCRRGLAYEKLGDLAHAVDDYETASKAQPGYGWPKYLLGRAAMKHEEYADAISLLTAAIDADPSFANSDGAYTYRRQAHLALGYRHRAMYDEKMIAALALVKKVEERHGLNWRSIAFEKYGVSAGEGMVITGAISKAHFQVKAFLQAGVSPDGVLNIDGKTALHYACHYAEFKTAQLLLNYGASPDIKDLTGKTPLDYLKAKLLEGPEGVVGDIMYHRVEEVVGKDGVLPASLRFLIFRPGEAGVLRSGRIGRRRSVPRLRGGRKAPAVHPERRRPSCR